MSLTLVLTGIVFRLVALYRTAKVLRIKTDWRLILLAVAISASLFHLFYWYRFSLSAYAGMHIAIAATSFLYGVVFLITANISEHYILAFREKNRALANHVNLFEQFANTAPLACFIFQDNHIVFSNHAASEITGYSNAELAVLPPHKIAHEHSRDYLLNLQNIKDNNVSSFESSIQLITKSGETRWGLATFGSAVYNGKPSIVGTILDVTRHKNAEQAILQAEERIRMATNASNTVVWDVDLRSESSTFIVPEALTEEYSFAEKPGRDNLLMNIYEPDKSIVEETVKKCMELNEAIEITFRRYNNEGALKWWRLNGKAQLDASGRPYRLLGTSRCIHDQKIADLALKENEARLRLATEIAGIQVWEWAVGTNEVIHDNDENLNTCAQVTGFEDFIRRIHPDYKERVQESVERTINEGVKYEEEFPLLDNNGAYQWQHSVGQLFYDDQGNPVHMIGAALDTTERRKKDELIHFQADLLDKIGQGIVSQNAQGEIIYLNKAAQKLYEIALKDKAPLNISGLIPDEHRIINKPEIMSKLRSGKQWAGELMAYTVKGSQFPIFLTASPLFNEKKEFDGFVGISTDVSALKEIQGALQISEAKNHAILDALPDMFFSVNSSGVFTDFKANKDQELAVPRDQIIGMKTSDLHGPEFAHESMYLISETIRTQTLQVMEYSLNQEKGQTFFEARFAPAGPDNVLIVVRNITKRKQTENALVARSFELQTIADTIPDSILRIDRNLEIKFANKAFLERVKMPLEEIVGVDATKLGSPDPDQKTWISNIYKVFETNKLVEFDINFSDAAQGPQNYHAFIAPESMEGDNVVSVLAVLRNITEERRLQQTIIDISARQQRSIGQDLHDELGQLLTGVGFKIASLQRDLESSGISYIEQTLEIGKLVELAIRQTRTLAEGLNPVTLEVHGLRAGLEKLALNTENTFGVSCPFTCDEDFNIKDEETAVQIYRIGQEAVNNAIKHGNPSKINISLIRMNGTAELMVKDDGVGFVNTPRDGHGLRIMNYRARVIGATFQIDSAPHKGTTVRCKFKHAAENHAHNIT